MPRPKHALSDYGSKINKIFIELHNFHFFHRPSEVDELDTRFVGRKKIVEKLKTLLTQNKSNSGAYLVTGYRGMGKTSLVNKVLTEIKGNISDGNSPRITFLYFFVVFFFFCFFSPYGDSGQDKSTFYFIILPTTLLTTVISLISLKNSYPGRNNLKLTKNLRKYRQGFINDIFTVSHSSSKYKYRNTLKYIFWMGLIQFCSMAFWEISLCMFDTKINFQYRFNTYFILILVGAIIWFAFGVQQKYKSQKQVEKNLKYSSFISNWLKAKLNFSQQIVIRLNLSYDNLTERDVLAVILKRLDKAYQKIDSWSLKNPLTVHWRFIRFVIYYTLFGILYYNTGLHKSTSEYLSQSRVLNYIPSQYIYTSKETEETRKALDLYLKDGVQDYGKYLRSLKITNNRTEYSSLNNFQQLSILFDFWVQRFYYDVSRDLLPLKSFINLEVRNITSNEVSSHFKFIPLYIDYLFFFLLFLSIFIINTFSYFGIIPFITHKRIKRKLKYLIDRLNAEIQTESNRKFNYKYVGLDFGLFSGKRKRYPIIDERELEFELLGLLENISSIPKFLVRPQFVFVFDELDKIEPHHNTSIADKEEQSTFYRKGDTLLSKEFLRKRQQKISKLLSNLKHFLNTAHAKFIFLAGREMYDAALSETSDRDSFIGSIFHEVLYLNSFLTDPSDFRKRDITSLTEVYICQFLFPDGWKGQKTLKGYNQYLKEFFEEDSIENDKQEQYLLKEKRRKVIVTLQNFITYVTYRSSGAPKKIAHLFEGQIEQGSKTELENNSFNLTVGRNSDNSYLVFNYYDQYICGMITNIQTPFLLSISRNMQDLGDKLLVSTTYLIDHLYKFHRSGFAWRNLEITPEIIDINKAPELRKFINNIIQHLSKVHLQEIVSGLFNFKFHNKIANEISYVSKISESQSAAFNFTLDESLEIKQHYNLN